MSPTNKLVRHDRECKRKTLDRSLRLMTETRGAGSAGAVLLPGPWCPVGRLGCRRSRRRGRWCQGRFPGILLEFNKLATLSRVDRENHALLAMARLLAVEPHRVRVFHSELCPREGLLVFCHWHESGVESASKRRTRGLERGLCDGVVLLLEDECDDIAGVGRHKGRVVLDKTVGTTRHNFDLGGVGGQSGQKAEEGGEREELREHR